MTLSSVRLRLPPGLCSTSRERGSPSSSLLASWSAPSIRFGFLVVGGLGVSPSVSLPDSSSLEDDDGEEEAILLAPFCWGGPRDGIAVPLRPAFPKKGNLFLSLSIPLSLCPSLSLSLSQLLQLRTQFNLEIT